MEQAMEDRVTELNQNYNNLGEDLLLMEAVVIAMHHENEFPSEYITSSLCRMMDYTDQHLKEIRNLAKMLLRDVPRRREPPKQDGRVCR